MSFPHIKTVGQVSPVIQDHFLNLCFAVSVTYSFKDPSSEYNKLIL